MKRRIALAGAAVVLALVVVTAVWMRDDSDAVAATRPFWSMLTDAGARVVSGRRLLATHTTLRSPTVIPLGDAQVTPLKGKFDWLQHAYMHIFKKMRPMNSQFIVYPFNFRATDPTTHNETEPFPWGAVLQNNDANLPVPWQRASFFKYLASLDIDLGKSKALYDHNIAIVRVEATLSGRLRDLTYESGYYCAALHTFLGKFSKCFFSDDYRVYRMQPNSEPTSLVFVNETDVATGFLVDEETGDPRFGMVIIPDIVLGSHDILLGLLGPTGKQALVNYVNAGGSLYASGKSSIVLESVGLVSTGSVNTRTLLAAQSNTAYVHPCDPAATSYYERLMCMGLVTETNTDKIPTYILSSYRVNPDPSVNVLLRFDASAGTLIYRSADTGLEEPAPADDTPPLFLRKPIGKGQILINLVHPTAHHHKDFPLFYNAVFMSLGRNVMVNNWAKHGFGSDRVDSDVFPALEADIALNTTYEVVNLFDVPLQDVVLKVWIPPGFDVLAAPPECIAVNMSDPVNEAPVKGLTGPFPLGYRCPLPGMGAFESRVLNFQLNVASAMATQRMRTVPVSYGTLDYTLATTGRHMLLDVGYTYIRAYMAALLRTDYNIDPSAFYPLPGRGAQIDAVLTAGNRENTMAHDVVHVAIAPLVSPLLDGNDQAAMPWILDLMDRYYDQSVNEIADYAFPFPNTVPRPYDFIDYKLLSSNDTTLVAEWDIPVKRRGYSRGDIATMFPHLAHWKDVDDVGNAKYNYDIETINMVLKQTNYPDADQHFEHAQPRLMPFADTTTIAGAYAKYAGNIPADVQNPNKPGTAKRQLALSRTDIFFRPQYESGVPKGVNDSGVFVTVDRYPNPPCSSDGKSSVHVPGYFSNTQPDGILADEYSSPMTAICNATMVHYSQVEEYTNGAVKKAHYLLPILFDELTDHLDLRGFDTGTFVDKKNNLAYPEIGFVFAHNADFLLDPVMSRHGGILEYTLPVGIGFADPDPAGNDRIAYSVDHIAVRETQYNPATRTITTYFRRGHMPNERWGKPSVVGIGLEGLQYTSQSGVPHNFTTEVYVRSLRFDFTGASPNFEEYSAPVLVTSATFIKFPFLSLPALKMEFRLPRGAGKNESYMNAYENLQPFVRYGFWYQEVGHRTVWGVDEAHNVNNPGLVCTSGGFSAVSTIGISSIPFREYLTTGVRQVIPYASENSRVEWKDIWGRLFSQPVRSTFVDVPPIPPPLRNFMQTTTFQLLEPHTGKRLLEWASDRDVDVHVLVKLLNNYPKYFDPTSCADNREYVLKRLGGSQTTVFGYNATAATTDPKYQINATYGRDSLVSIQTDAHYGACWDEPNTVLSTTRWEDLTAAQQAAITDSQLCEVDLENCSIPAGTPTLIHWPGTPADKSGTDWNYSPDVLESYPQDYIEPDMWDMTHKDYQDTFYFKGYPFHLDNRLPNIDVGIARPHNIIALPIWKGLGYMINYDPSYNTTRFPGKTGWWSDNLQNKDDTLLAGQAKNNRLNINPAVDKPDDSLLSPSDWIPIDQLEDAGTLPTSALKNIYVCLFNRHRVRVDPNSKILADLPNVLQNNIVPIIPSLSKWDSRLFSYDCDLSQGQYSPTNISAVDNRVRTNAARDWLYFAANLRGAAKETINLLLQLRPFSDVHYEGSAKVYDGGRFVYWNPANGPNSFLVVDNPPIMVHARRTDLTVNGEILPVEVTTFASEFYQIITIEDAAERFRQFRQRVYYNYYGFGDTAVHVYVGEQDTGAILSPGRSTLVKLEFYNNAGFDWEMKKNAMEGPTLDQSSLGVDDPLSKLVVAVQDVSAYNFIRWDMDAALAPYVNITPSDHVKDWQPLFFDFANINVPQIRDGFKGSYFVRVSLSADAPDSLGGKLHEIQPVLLEEYFAALPGTATDPTTTGYHDYTVVVPPIRFGIPFPPTYIHRGMRGRVYYSSGRAENVISTGLLPNTVTVEGAKVITSYDITKMRQFATIYASRDKGLRDYFWKLPHDAPVPIVAEPYGDGSTGQKISIDLAAMNWTSLPMPQNNYPDLASFYLCVRLTSTYFPYGRQQVGKQLDLKYDDFAGRAKTAADDVATYEVIAKGASLFATASAVLVNPHTLQPMDVGNRLIPNTTNILRVSVSLTNDGSAVAYETKVRLFLASNITTPSELVAAGVSSTVEPDGTWTMEVPVGQDLPPGDSVVVLAYLSYDAPDITFGHKRFIDRSSAELDLTTTPGEHRVTQPLDLTLVSDLTLWVPVAVSLKVDNGSYPDVSLTATTDPSAGVTSFTFYRLAMDGTAAAAGATWTLAGTVQGNGIQDGTAVLVDPVDRADADYLVTALRQDDEAHPAVEVGQSDVENLRWRGVDVPKIVGILIGVIAGTVALGGAIFFALSSWGGRRYYYRRKDLHNGPYTPDLADTVDREVAIVVNRIERLNKKEADRLAQRKAKEAAAGGALGRARAVTVIAREDVAAGVVRVDAGMYRLGGEGHVFEVKKKGGQLLVYLTPSTFVRLDDYLKQPAADDLALARRTLRQTVIGREFAYLQEDRGAAAAAGADGGEAIELGAVTVVAEGDERQSTPLLAREENAPASPPTPPPKPYIVVWDYHARRQDELTLRVGQRILVTQRDDAWYHATDPATGESGRVPSNYITPEVTT